MEVYAKLIGAFCIVRVLQAGNIITRQSRTEIARLDIKPLTEATALFGVQDGAWGLLHVGTDGVVTIYHIFGTETLSWGLVDVSLSFLAV